MSQAGFSPASPQKASRQPHDRPLIIAIWLVALLTLVATIFVIVLLTKGNKSDTQKTGIANPSSTQEPDSPSNKANITNRHVDSADLSVEEIFPTQTIEVQGRKYDIRRTEYLNSCVAATIGVVIAEAINRYECHEVVRATIIDEASEYAGTIAVANMTDAAGAAALDNLLKDPAKNGAFFLLAADGISFAENQEKLTSHTWRGHFTIVTVITPADPNKQTVNENDTTVKNFLRDCEQYLVGRINKRTQ